MKRLCFILVFIFVLAFVSYSFSRNEALPSERPENFGFALDFGVGAKNKLNTYEGTFTKDMIIDAPVSTHLELTEKELDDIYGELLKIDIMNYPDIYFPTDRGYSTPYISYNLKACMNGKIKAVYWEDKYFSQSKKSADLRRTINKIIEIIMQKEEYKLIIEARGGNA